MTKFLKFLRVLLATLILIASLGVLAGWWWMHRTLPQTDGSISLLYLKQQVSVDRDNYGVPTITAQSMGDLLFAQGFVMAQDRMWQMDMIRRSAAGELSEVLGSVTLEMDKENRVLGLRPASEAAVAALSPEQREQLEAYSAGVNAYIEQNRSRLPWEFQVLRYEPKPWTATDSILIHGYMFKLLSTTWEWELARARVTEIVGSERAKDLFVVESPDDRPIVGNEPAPAKPATVLRKAAQANLASPERARVLSSAALALADPREDLDLRAGSNNWVVSGAYTYSGKPLLANDTHLPNDVPSIWYMAHLKAPGYNAKGFCLPGGPLVVIGHNEHIAWGFTNNDPDVQDLYIEIINPENPHQYRVNGKWAEASVRNEVIKVKDGPDQKLEVLVTRHGPVVHRDAKGAYALQWTALQPGGLGTAHAEASRANNWQEFLAAMRRISGPAQNAVYADTEGNIGFVVAANIPIRKKGDGSVPVPGDTDDYGWTGYIPFDELPQVLNPPSGRIASANARVVGPGYKHYLTNRWYEPSRTKRIFDLLEGHKDKFKPADFIAIQTDYYSEPHTFIARQLKEAAKAVAPQDPRVISFIRHLAGWDGRALASSRQMPVLEYLRRDLLQQILKPYLKEETSQYQWSRTFTFLRKVLQERPAAWLPPQFKSYDDLIVASADNAFRQLERDARSRGDQDPANFEQWRWGQVLPLRMLHPFGRSGFLRRHLSIADIGQNGSGYSVKQTGRAFGPAMRFVADLANFDGSFMNITLGQSGQYLSPHYRDQFEFWLDGRGLPSAFSKTAEDPRRQHHLMLTSAH